MSEIIVRPNDALSKAFLFDAFIAKQKKNNVTYYVNDHNDWETVAQQYLPVNYLDTSTNGESFTINSLGKIVKPNYNALIHLIKYASDLKSVRLRIEHIPEDVIPSLSLALFNNKTINHVIIDTTIGSGCQLNYGKDGMICKSAKTISDNKKSLLSFLLNSLSDTISHVEFLGNSDMKDIVNGFLEKTNERYVSIPFFPKSNLLTLAKITIINSTEIQRISRGFNGDEIRTYRESLDTSSEFYDITEILSDDNINKKMYISLLERGCLSVPMSGEPFSFQEFFCNIDVENLFMKKLGINISCSETELCKIIELIGNKVTSLRIKCEITHQDALEELRILLSKKYPIDEPNYCYSNFEDRNDGVYSDCINIGVYKQYTPKIIKTESTKIKAYGSVLRYNDYLYNSWRICDHNTTFTPNNIARLIATSLFIACNEDVSSCLIIRLRRNLSEILKKENKTGYKGFEKNLVKSITLSKGPPLIY